MYVQIPVCTYAHLLFCQITLWNYHSGIANLLWYRGSKIISNVLILPPFTKVTYQSYRSKKSNVMVSKISRIVLNAWGSLQIEKKNYLVEDVYVVNAFIVASFVLCSSNGVGIISKLSLKWYIQLTSSFGLPLHYYLPSLKIIAMSLAAASRLSIYPHTSDWCWYVCADFCCQVVRMRPQENNVLSKFDNWMQLIGTQFLC